MFKNEAKYLCAEYCSNSCIHGVRFLASKRLTILERCIWMAALLFAGYNIVKQVWYNWNYLMTYPMQVVETASRLPLSEFYFPGVTLCSVFKIKYARAEAHIQRVLGPNVTKEERDSYWNTLITLGLLHYPHYDFPKKFLLTYNITRYPIRNEDIPGIFLEVSHRVEDIFKRCLWRGTEYNCSDLFHAQRTEEGLCFAFNSWTAEEHSSKNKFYEQYFHNGKLEPLKNTAAGKHTGLEVLLNPPDVKFFHSFQEHSMGYNIIIHSPMDYPDISMNIQVEKHPVQVQRIYIKPVKYMSAASVKEAPRKEKMCNWNPDDTVNSLVTSDRNLCFIQCRLNSLKVLCDCTPYYFPAENGTEYCDFQHFDCLYKKTAIIRNHEYNNFNEIMQINDSTLICNCLRACSYVLYETELSRSTINLPETIGVYAIVEVSYKERHGRGNRREVTYTISDYAVTVGGVASLLLGCSVISILEIIYYIIRLIIVGLKAMSVELCAEMKEKQSDIKTVSSRQSLRGTPSDYPFLP